MNKKVYSINDSDKVRNELDNGKIKDLVSIFSFFFYVQFYKCRNYLQLWLKDGIYSKETTSYI